VRRKLTMPSEKATKALQRRGSARGGDKKLAAPVTLFAVIEVEQHDALRAIAFAERRSLADVVREALSLYLAQHAQPQAIPPVREAR
jgi:hypothetical protein